ncbi:MAG: hypothetical protein NVS3B21_32030 [Acidimicrobiales bacterium]
MAQLQAPQRDEVARLSAAENDVLRLTASGLSNEAIALRLCVSPRTVEGRLSVLYSKLGLTEESGLNRRVCAVILYLEST